MDDCDSLRPMFGTFQHSNLRIEVNAPERLIRDVLTQPKHLQTWMWPQRLSRLEGEALKAGNSFTSWLGPIAIDHQVDSANGVGIRLLLSGGIDGFHIWHWGDGWVQSNLEGISLLPLNLGQTMSLLRLKEYLARQQASASPDA
jgi:hypothetical protein